MCTPIRPFSGTVRLGRQNFGLLIVLPFTGPAFQFFTKLTLSNPKVPGLL